jgi:hypothetical protein
MPRLLRKFDRHGLLNALASNRALCGCATPNAQTPGQGEVLDLVEVVHGGRFDRDAWT